MGKTLTKEELKAAYDGFKKIRQKSWKKEEWIRKDVKAENPKNQYIYNDGFYGSDWLYDIKNGLGEWELFEEEPSETNRIPMIVKNLPEDIKRIVHEYARSENRKINEDNPISTCIEFDKTPEKYLIWNDVTSGNYESFYNFRKERYNKYLKSEFSSTIRNGDSVKYIGPDTDEVNKLASISRYIREDLYLTLDYNKEYVVEETLTSDCVRLKGIKCYIPATCFKIVKRKEDKVEPPKSVPINEAKLEKVHYKVGSYVSFKYDGFNNVRLIGKVVESRRRQHDLYKVEIRNINNVSGFHDIVSICVYDDNHSEMQHAELHDYQLQQFKQYVHHHYPYFPIDDSQFYKTCKSGGVVTYGYRPTIKPIFTDENCLNLDNILTASTMFTPSNNNSQNKTQQNEQKVIQTKQQENLVFSKTQKKKNKLQLTPIKTLNY